MLTRRTVLWAKRETTYGTDPALSSADGVLVYDLNLEIKGEKLDRPVLRDTLSPIAHVIGMKEVSLTFKTELKGIGAVTSIGAFELDDLLSGAGFDTGVYTGTTTVYSLTSTENAMGSVSFAVFLDEANKHKIVGARGTPKFNLKAGKYGEIEWSFQGLYVAVAAATTPAYAGLGTVLPPIVYNSGFQIAGFSPVCSSAEIDLGVEVVKRESLNAADGVHSFRITGRKPTMKFDADAVAESSNPFWGDWAGNVVDTYGIQIGSTPTNIIKMTGYFEYVQPKYGDADGIRKFDCEAALVSSNAVTGNDEFRLTFI